MSSLAVGLVNFGMSIISLWIVNSFGRRRLLFVGLTGQICGLAIDVGDYDRRTCAGEALGAGSPETAAGSGDDGGASA
jgi:hypothetical protein